MSSFILLLYFYQRRLIYFPFNDMSFQPEDYDIRNYENVTLTTGDQVQIHCWLIKNEHQVSDASKVPTFIWFHGNAGNISYRLDQLVLLKKIPCNVLMVSYRGYGLSKGKPSEKGFCLDAQAALDYLLTRDDINKNEIYVLGQSIGGAVAINLVRNNQSKVRGLILENTFSSLVDMMKIVFPTLRHFSFLLSDKWDSVKKISDIKVPTLYLSGQMDSLVPPSMMQKLFDHQKDAEHKMFVKIPKGDHNDTWIHKEYMVHIQQFVDGIKYTK